MCVLYPPLSCKLLSSWCLQFCLSPNLQHIRFRLCVLASLGIFQQDKIQSQLLVSSFSLPFARLWYQTLLWGWASWTWMLWDDLGGILLSGKRGAQRSNASGMERPVSVAWVFQNHHWRCHNLDSRMIPKVSCPSGNNLAANYLSDYLSWFLSAMFCIDLGLRTPFWHIP